MIISNITDINCNNVIDSSLVIIKKIFDSIELVTLYLLNDLLIMFINSETRTRRQQLQFIDLPHVISVLKTGKADVLNEYMIPYSSKLTSLTVRFCNEDHLIDMLKNLAMYCKNLEELHVIKVTKSLFTDKLRLKKFSIQHTDEEVVLNRYYYQLETILSSEKLTNMSILHTVDVTSETSKYYPLHVFNFRVYSDEIPQDCHMYKGYPNVIFRITSSYEL